MNDKATEKTYLRWYNKVGYGSGDVAGNVVYALLSAFVMIYLTDTAGLNAGVIGTLMMVSRLFDGFSDIIFGALMDKTRTRMGKARPWMLWAFLGCAAMVVAIFAIPVSMGDTAKYAWFFIAYTLLNGVFFTANNIAYSALTALITKNSEERVQMGSIRFMFAFGTNLLIQTVTVSGVETLGGGAEGWRAIAIVYALVGLVFNTLSVLSVKELSPEELAAVPEAGDGPALPVEQEKLTLRQSARMLANNKYYLIILVVFILTQIFTAMLNMGIYFMTYILGDAKLLGAFAWAINIPMIIGLLLIFSGVAALGMSPLQGTLNAMIAEASEYTFLRTGKRIDGTMFSCTSLGVKVGSGVGTAVAGWLLAVSGYVGNADQQPQSAISMLYFMYVWIPVIANAVILFLLSRLDVEKANKRLRELVAESH